MTATPIPMYQGEDFSQQLSYFTDTEQTDPLVFTHPVMDIRSPGGTLLARFDDSGTQHGLAEVTDDGVLLLTMAYANTALLRAGKYDLDIFADVGSSREAITKRGLLRLIVTARITVDDEV